MNQWMRVCFSRERRGHINFFTPTKNFAQACALSLHHSPFFAQPVHTGGDVIFFLALLFTHHSDR
jgi:hypothetical protein